MAARVALGKIKNDATFIEFIFATKAAREVPQEIMPQNEVVSQEEVNPQEIVAQTEEAVFTSIPVTEEIEKSEEVEQIISEAEEAAFKETV